MPRKWRKNMKPEPAFTEVFTSLFDDRPRDPDIERVFGPVVLRHGDLAVHEERTLGKRLYVLRRGDRSEDGAVGHFVDILPALPRAEELPALYEALADD